MEHSIKFNRRVVVGISGGVDSAVTLALLKQAGYDVYAVSLRTWIAPSTDAPHEPTEDASALAALLDVPFEIVDVRERFYEEIILPFVKAYGQGITPNPCVRCNPSLKFDALLKVAQQIEANWIATGHYAQIIHSDTGPSRLLEARNRHKDQSYVLYRLTQRHLKPLLCPLGDMADKAEVRAIAEQLELPGAKRPDSQDLCFIHDYRQLLKDLNPQSLTPGPIYDTEGILLGEHQGLGHYTVGQRGGLGIAASKRLYVLRLEPEHNALIVGTAEALNRTSCKLSGVTFTAEAAARTFTAQGRIRYRATRVPITVELSGTTEAYVTFTTPQRGVSPGQSLVFYQDNEVLGGGIIMP